MALTDSIRLGGVYLDVRIDRRKVMDDVRSLKAEVERTLGTSTFAPRSTPGSGTTGFRQGYSGPGNAGTASIASQAAIQISQIAVGSSSSAPVMATIRAVGARTNMLLARIAANTAVSKGIFQAQDRAARSAFRADRASFRRAQASAGLRQLLIGRHVGIEGPTGAIGTLPADVRYFGGIAFDENQPYRRQRRPMPSRMGAGAAAQMAATQQHAATTAAAQAASAATTPGHAAQAATTAASAASAAAAQQVNFYTSTVAVAAAQQVTFAATTAASETADNLVTKIGVTPRAAAQGVRPGHYQRRRSGEIGWQFGHAGGPREPGMGPGTTSGNFRRGGRRGGFIDFGILGGLRNMSSPIDPGSLQRVKYLLTEIVSPITSLIGLHKALSGASLYAFNRMQSAIEAYRRHIGRMMVTLGPFGTALALPFKTALLPLRLFSRRVDSTIRELGHVQAISIGMQNTVAAPFRAAAAPVSLLGTLLRNLGLHLGIIGAFMAGRQLFRGIEFAVEMTETINVADQAFGRFANDVGEHSRTAAEKFGLVQESILETSNTFGLLLTGMGMTEEKAAQISTKLSDLTADMSSFYNVSQEEAASAISSALRGQFRPISRYGVMIRKEDINALAEARGEANRLGEAAATLDLIFSGLSAASGDLARTMNSPANLMREFRGRVANLAGEIGEKLLPAWRELLLGLNDLMTTETAFGRTMANALDQFGKSAQRAIHFVRQMLADTEGAGQLIGAAFRVARENASEVFTWLARTSVAVGRVVAGTIGDLFMAAFEGLREGLKALWYAIGNDLVISMTKSAMQAGTQIWELLRDPTKAAARFGVDALFNRDAGAAAGQAAADATQGRFASILERFANFTLPEFTPQRGQAWEDFQVALDRIQGVALRGDGQEAAGPRGVLRPEADMAAEEQAAMEGRSAGRSSGQLVSAEQLREMQNQAATKDKQIDLLYQIAQGIRTIANLTAEEKTRLGNQLSTMVAAVPIP